MLKKHLSILISLSKLFKKIFLSSGFRKVTRTLTNYENQSWYCGCRPTQKHDLLEHAANTKQGEILHKATTNTAGLQPPWELRWIEGGRPSIQCTVWGSWWSQMWESWSFQMSTTWSRPGFFMSTTSIQWQCQQDFAWRSWLPFYKWFALGSSNPVMLFKNTLCWHSKCGLIKIQKGAHS